MTQLEQSQNIQWATGTMSKSFRKYLSKIPRKHEIKKLRKTVILGTAQLHGKVLMHMCEIFNVGNNITCAKNCN